MCLYAALLGDIPLLPLPFHNEEHSRVPGAGWGTWGHGGGDTGSRLELQPQHCAKPHSLPQLTALKPSSSIYTVFYIYFPYYFLREQRDTSLAATLALPGPEEFKNGYAQADFEAMEVNGTGL